MLVGMSNLSGSTIEQSFDSKPFSHAIKGFFVFNSSSSFNKSQIGVFYIGSTSF